MTPSDWSTTGWCQERDSNPHCPDSETGDSCRWSILASCHPRDSNPHCPAPQAGASCRWARVAYRVRASSPRDAASKATVLRQRPGEEDDGLEPYGVSRALLSREAPRHRGFVFQVASSGRSRDRAGASHPRFAAALDEVRKKESSNPSARAPHRFRTGPGPTRLSHLSRGLLLRGGLSARSRTENTSFGGSRRVPPGQRDGCARSESNGDTSLRRRQPGSARTSAQSRGRESRPRAPFCKRRSALANHDELSRDRRRRRGLGR